MTRHPAAVDIDSMPEVTRLAREVATSGRRRVLRENGAEIAVLSPARPRRRLAKALTLAERESVLGTAGGWVGLVDGETLKQELKESREDRRPPVEL